MIYVNSIQVMLMPVVLILLIHSYVRYVVVVENFQVNPVDIKLAPLEGALSVNDELSRADILWDKDGVQSVVKLNGQLYLGTSNGIVVKYDPAKERFDTVIRFNAKITSIRPSEDGNLYLLSVCTGIFKLDLTTKRLMLVYDHRAKAPMLNPSNATHLNDFVVLPGEDKSSFSFLIAQSSRRWTSRQLYLSHLEGDKSGQLIKYIPKIDQLEIVREGLAFPKSLELSDDRTSVLVTEWLERRVQRLYLSGPKKGQLELVVNSLPGEPNHIRRSESQPETYWVPVNAARNATHYGNLDRISSSVLPKEVILYLIKGVDDLFVIFKRFIDADYWSFRWNSYVFDWYLNDFKHGLVIQIDANGKILNSLHSTTGRLTNIEEAVEIDLNKQRNLFLTSAFNQFIAKLSV